MPSVSTYSAAVIAGGSSKRMGRDKSFLPVGGGSELLWQRQLRVLNELQPQQLFWSGPERSEMPLHVSVISDEVPHAGPLAGISACLEATQSDLLIVLAVDLPGMTSLYLAGMLARCTTQCGIVARRDDFYEPLAAVYPKALASLAEDHLRDGQFALQEFVSAGIRQILMKSFDLDAGDEKFFKNLNSPTDLL